MSDMQNCRVDEKNHDIASAIDRRTFHRTAGRSVAVIVSLYLGLASLTAAASGENGGGLAVLPVPRKLATFSFQNEQGESLSLQDFHGKLVVLNLWATWCAPCAREMPSLDRLHNKLQPLGGMVLALSQDRGGLAKVAPFLAQNRLDLAPYLDMSNAASKALNVAALPTTVIVAPNGLEVARLIGAAVWDGPDIIRRLQGWLAPTAL